MIWMCVFFIFFAIIFSIITIFIKEGKCVTSVISGAFFFISILFFVFSIFTTVPNGHVGIQNIFGKVSPNVLSSGLVTKNPFAKINKINIQTQEIKEISQVPSKEGLLMQLEVSLIFHINSKESYNLYKNVGLNYKDVIITPQLRSAMREITSLYEAKALYSSERDKISDEIFALYNKMIENRGIIVEQLLLRDIDLPKQLAEAIETKLKSEQASEEMKFILSKELQEAERKRIEAQGISDFQKIVTEGINDNLLKWKGIEATEKLASSANSKMIIIGGKDGLPLLLNSQ